MQLKIVNGTVVLSLENKNRDYLSEYGHFFKGFQNGCLKMDRLTAADGLSDVQATNTYWLEQVVEGAVKHGVEIDQSVLDKLREMQAEADKLYGPATDIIAEKPAEIEHWEKLCKDGCGSCKNLCRSNVDYFCTACGEVLPEKNMPGYVGGVYALFNYVPFPADSCPFNIKKIKEKIL